MSAFSLHLKPVSSSGAAYANVPVQIHRTWAGCASMLRKRHSIRTLANSLLMASQTLLHPRLCCKRSSSLMACRLHM